VWSGGAIPHNPLIWKNQRLLQQYDLLEPITTICNLSRTSIRYSWNPCNREIDQEIDIPTQIKGLSGTATKTEAQQQPCNIAVPYMPT
jgi:hypothetical protein